jgi:hypothetical protein
MRQAFLTSIPNMIDDLKILTTQTDFVMKSYISVYRNGFNTISMDVQMQTMCKKILERFNLKLKGVNLNDLATYRYLLYFDVILQLI